MLFFCLLVLIGFVSNVLSLQGKSVVHLFCVSCNVASTAGNVDGLIVNHYALALSLESARCVQFVTLNFYSSKQCISFLNRMVKSNMDKEDQKDDDVLDLFGERLEDCPENEMEEEDEDEEGLNLKEDEIRREEAYNFDWSSLKLRNPAVSK